METIKMVRITLTSEDGDAVIGIHVLAAMPRHAMNRAVAQAVEGFLSSSPEMTGFTVELNRYEMEVGNG